MPITRSMTALAIVLSLGGCYKQKISKPAPEPTTVAVAPAPNPTPTPSPTPPPAAKPAGTPVSVAPDKDGIRQLASIPSNFSTDGLLEKVNVPGSADPDTVGAFRFTCRASHLAYDDPIVFPNQKGRAHLHMFFGNTKADADSTYESLRTTGDSTCNNKLNRSSYWTPALMNGQGQVVLPENITIYYKRFPASSEECRTGAKCIPLPRGLRYIFGRSMQGQQTGGAVHFRCDGGSTGAHFGTLPEAAAVCPVGATLIASVEAPQCWDGVNLDSPDHRSHLAYPVKAYGGLPCPTTHPYRIPTFTIGLLYKVDESLDRSGDLSTSRRTWYFSSDRMAGMTPQISGSTFHADWFGAWDDEILKEWTDHCIDKKLSCASGLLGSGRKLSEREAAAVSMKGRLVATPPDPKT